MALQYAHYKPNTSVFDCTGAVLTLGGATEKYLILCMFPIIENFKEDTSQDFLKM